MKALNALCLIFVLAAPCWAQERIGKRDEIAHTVARRRARRARAALQRSIQEFPRIIIRGGSVDGTAQRNQLDVINQRNAAIDVPRPTLRVQLER